MAATYKNMTAAEFSSALTSALEKSQEREKLLGRLITSAINVALESRDSSRLNALATAFASASEWQKLKAFAIHATGGIALQIVQGKPQFIAQTEQSCLRYDAKARAFEIIQIQNFEQVLDLWRNQFRALHYKALNPSQQPKPLRLELLKAPFVRLRNNPDKWDSSQRREIAKALEALAVIFGD